MMIIYGSSQTIWNTATSKWQGYKGIKRESKKKRDNLFEEIITSLTGWGNKPNQHL